jgi:hypothetical protein
VFLVGPKTGHSWHPDSRAESNAFINKALESADTAPTRVRFVTYTTRFNRAHWLTVDGLEETYKRAEVDATRSKDGADFTVTTKNVSHLTVEAPHGVFTIDGQKTGGIGSGSVSATSKRPLISGPSSVSLEKVNGKWSVATGASKGLRKVHGLQGPVDDAFMDAFLCVRPTGEPWNQVTREWATKTLDVFSANFAKWLRGDVRVKDDRAVSAADIAEFNLILFGDPGSNSVIAKVLGDLPIRWTKSSIEIASRTFSADHVPVLIYPNPLNPKRYVVLNSGHTFGDEDFRGTNAWLYPRLADYSVVKANGEVALSAFFDEHWRAK